MPGPMEVTEGWPSPKTSTTVPSRPNWRSSHPDLSCAAHAARPAGSHVGHPRRNTVHECLAMLCDSVSCSCGEGMIRRPASDYYSWREWFHVLWFRYRARCAACVGRGEMPR
jgi:hypothetical protein